MTRNSRLLLGGYLVVGIGGVSAFLKRKGFNAHLKQLKSQIRHSGSRQGPGADLPSEVQEPGLPSRRSRWCDSHLLRIGTGAEGSWR
jgi:hypothetical protein